MKTHPRALECKQDLCLHEIGGQTRRFCHKSNCRLRLTFIRHKQQLRGGRHAEEACSQWNGSRMNTHRTPVYTSAGKRGSISAIPHGKASRHAATPSVSVCPKRISHRLRFTNPRPGVPSGKLLILIAF